MINVQGLCSSLLAFTIFLNACSAIPTQVSVERVLEKPYQSGIEITKPTYTPHPTTAKTAALQPTATFTPTTSPTPLETATSATFAEDAFVIIEDLPQREDQNSTSAYNGSKYILVDISEQHMYVYEGNSLVYSFIASTGMDNSTRVGTFSVLNKIPNAYGETWNIWMPNWLGIYWSGNLQNGIHALPILPGGGILWAGYLGTPISYGCIVLGTHDAQALYNWVEIGTPVKIRW